LFRLKEGYGKGCPWNCKFGRKGIEYRAEDYPETLKMLDEVTFVRGFMPPNGLKLIDHYIEAFEKVFSNLDPVMRISESIQ